MIIGLNKKGNSRTSVIVPFAKEESYDIIIKCICFLVSPFLSFFYSLRTMDRKSSYVCFFLFAVFWCMIQCPTEDSGTDMSRNMMIFEKLASDNNVTAVELFIMSDGGRALYTFVFLKAVTSFTSNYHWFIIISGCIISFFQLKSFRFFTSSPSFKNGWKALVLACMFAMHAPLFWAGAIRWILAGWITVYGTLQIWMNKDNRYWLVFPIATFIHFSFLVYFLVFIVAYFTRKRESMWAVLLLFSFALQVIMPVLYENVSKLQGILPSFLVGNMGDEEFMEEINERIAGLNTIPRFISLYLFPYFPTVIAYFFYFNRGVIRSQSQNIYSLFRLTLVVTFFFNVLSAMPDIGRRFGWIIYVYYSIVMVYCFCKNKYAWIYVLYLISSSVMIYGDIRGKWLLMNDPIDWITNPFTLIGKYLINPVM